jgi:hypothetical protein
MSLEIINKIDEQGRFYGIEFHIGKYERQGNSHGSSYKSLRSSYREIGDVMGFDKSISLYNYRLLGYIPGIKR